MDSLVRRIRDLDPITFQQLCFCVISERFPSATVRYPEGAAGDEGVDLFQGDLSGEATIWQCKAFQVTILGNSQKEQIRKSLRDAIRKTKPKQWILCLNLNFDTKAVRWFKKLQESYLSQGIAVADPFGAMELAKELMFRRTIKNTFFPNLALDVQELKALMKAAGKGMDSVDDGALEQLATENAEEYLDRLRERDSRFLYEVTFGGERGPRVFPPPIENDLIAAMTDGRKTIKAFVRDHNAVRQDPVTSHIEFSENGAQKLFDLVRTGKNQHWEPEEIRAFKSTFPLLSDMKFVPGSMSMSVQSVPDDRMIPLKLAFSNGAARATLDYIEFRRVRGGAAEVEIATIGTHPLQITFILPTNNTSTVTATVSTNMAGHTIRDVAQMCAALKLLEVGCDIELYSLKLNGSLCRLHVEPLPISFNKNVLKFVDDLDAIAVKFGVNFPMPNTLKLDEEEEETFMILRAFAFNEPVKINTMTNTLIKSPENATLVPQQFREEIVLRIANQNTTASLFGTFIELGATVIHIDSAEVLNFAETMKRFKEAEMGTAVPIVLRPLTPVRFEIANDKDFSL